ncbi:MAG: hypothetical protein ACU0AU_10585 [Cognatishimia activa]
MVGIWATSVRTIAVKADFPMGSAASGARLQLAYR